MIGVGVSIVSAVVLAAGETAPVEFDAFFSNEAATYPWYNATHPPGVHVASRNETYYATEGYSGERRVARITVRHHDYPITDERAWSGPHTVGLGAITNDDHGAIALLLDGDGLMHVFFGEHNGNALKHSVETAPGSHIWTPNPDITDINACYPHPHYYDGKIYLFARHAIAGRMVLRYKVTATLVMGVPTWNASVEVVNFGDDSRVYMGNQVLVGSVVHMPLTRADYDDSVRKGFYYVKFDLADGQMADYAETVSVAPGSYPLDLTTADASFKIYSHAANKTGNIPALALDANNKPMCLVSNGTVPVGTFKTPTDLLELHNDDSGWSTPAKIADMTGRYDGYCLVYDHDGDQMQALYAVDDDNLFDRGGNIRQVNQTGGLTGTFGASQLIGTPERGFALDVPCAVKFGTAEARSMWGEIAEDSATESALRTYASNDNGAMRRRSRTLLEPRDIAGLTNLWLADDCALGRAWVDSRGGRYVSVANDPIPGAISFNGAFPGVTFDGTLKYFTISSFSGSEIPVGSGASEMWFLGTIDPSTAIKIIASYGATSGAARRTLSIAANTGYVTIDDGATALVHEVDVTGSPVLIRAQWSVQGGLTTIAGWVNGVPFSPTPSRNDLAPLATGNTRMRIGVSTANTPTLPLKGVMNLLGVVTGTLDVTNAQLLEGILLHPRDLEGLLMIDHPHRNTAPAL